MANDINKRTISQYSRWDSFPSQASDKQINSDSDSSEPPTVWPIAYWSDFYAAQCYYRTQCYILLHVQLVTLKRSSYLRLENNELRDHHYQNRLKLTINELFVKWTSTYESWWILMLIRVFEYNSYVLVHLSNNSLVVNFNRFTV